MSKFSPNMIPFRFRLTILVIVFLSLAEGSTPPKSKRQIYREQVLPSRGGKIPDAAFTSDRLALNRLNKEGISIPDGVLLEHRHVHSHPHINQHDPEDEDSLIKIVQRPEDRYVASPGKYDDKRPLTVSSTYIIRKPIGADGAGIRTPLEQIPFHETLSQHQGNQIYQSYPETYYQPSYTPHYVQSQIPHKYLPSELTAPPQKFLPVDVSVPPQKYVPVEVSAPPQKYLPVEIPASPQKYRPAPAGTVVHHPHPHGYSAPVSYQQVHQSVAYYPVTVPLELPNKDALKDEYYYSKSQGNAYGSHRDSEDIHGVINWPYLLRQYTQLSDKINVLDHESYGQPSPHSLFFTPEVLGSIDSGSRYYATSDRYARKSKEIAFTDTTPEQGGKNRLKDSRKLIKLKCTSRLENTVEEGSPKCFVRY